MTEPTAPPRIYPDVDELERIKRKQNGGSKVRFNEINRITDRLELDTKIRRKYSKRYKKIYNAFHGISIASGSLATTLSGVTIGLMSNPAVVLPLAITNVSLGAIGAATGIWSKSFIKRVEKHQKLFLLANKTLITINEILSESLLDNHVDDCEFKKVNTMYQNYLWDCKGIKDSFVQKNLVEKDVILKDINAAINK